MQRSEGGGLGVGGSSSGFMTARGAADFLTRSTAVLGGAVRRPVDRARRRSPASSREPAKVDTSLANTVAPAPVAPTVPLAGQRRRAAPATANQAAPADNQQAPVPLAQ